MTDIAELPVLNLAVLTEMYGDTSSQTICQVLTGFRDEAHSYSEQLRHAFIAGQFADVARLSHSLKSMCGLVGAQQMMTLCQNTEQAARAEDKLILNRCFTELNKVWPALLQDLESNLVQFSDNHA
jgi:HPt (histidine-containing phosphotransfer) domain-containing protein